MIPNEKTRVPLSALVETMANSSAPIVYQALIKPLPDWSGKADDRYGDIEWGIDTVTDQVMDTILMPVDEWNPTPP